MADTKYPNQAEVKEAIEYFDVNDERRGKILTAEVLALCEEQKRRDEALDKRIADEGDVIKTILLVNVRNANQKLHDDLMPEQEPTQ